MVYAEVGLSMIPRLPYLQNAVKAYHEQFDQNGTCPDHIHYIQWMRNQGVIMPIKIDRDIDSVRIEFTDSMYETMFILRWA